MSLDRIVRGLRFLNKIRREWAVIRPIMESQNYRFLQCAPPGHYYSPIPDLDEIDRRSRIVFDRSPTAIPGIDLCVDSQLSLASEFTAYYKTSRFLITNKTGPATISITTISAMGMVWCCIR